MHEHEPIRWRARATLERYDGVDIDEYRDRYGRLDGERRFFEENQPTSREEIDGNLLMTAGATALWTALTQGSAGSFQNATAAIGVGDSSTAESAAQTDLQAAINKARKGMDATYPQVSTNTCIFKSTFGTSDANFTWAEWGVFSAASGGTMLNRKVASLGSKTSAASWSLTVTLSLS